MTSLKFDPKLTRLSPLSCLNCYFTYTFIPSVTKVKKKPPPYLRDIINVCIDSIDRINDSLVVPSK